LDNYTTPYPESPVAVFSILEIFIAIGIVVSPNYEKNGEAGINPPLLKIIQL
jgi:hypothetical protein